MQVAILSDFRLCLITSSLYQQLDIAILRQGDLLTAAAGVRALLRFTRRMYAVGKALIILHGS